jgi:ubiquinone/menaquinone biosynthesis C-methylase UbiE
MAKPEWIARQSAHPRGWIGHLVARVMARDTARGNEIALEALAVEPGEDVLELGCGHGRSLALLSEREPTARLIGVDPSSVMRTEARRRNRAGVAANRIRVEDGDSGKLPFETGCFDAAFSVHTVYFWPDLAGGLHELCRVLRPGGRLLLAYRPDDPELRRELPDSVYRLLGPREIEVALAEAGFREIETRELHDGKARLALTLARAAER